MISLHLASSLPFLNNGTNLIDNLQPTESSRTFDSTMYKWFMFEGWNRNTAENRDNAYRNIDTLNKQSFNGLTFHPPPLKKKHRKTWFYLLDKPSYFGEECDVLSL